MATLCELDNKINLLNNKLDVIYNLLTVINNKILNTSSSSSTAEPDVLINIACYNNLVNSSTVNTLIPDKQEFLDEDNTLTLNEQNVLSENNSGILTDNDDNDDNNDNDNDDSDNSEKIYDIDQSKFPSLKESVKIKRTKSVSHNSVWLDHTKELSCNDNKSNILKKCNKIQKSIKAIVIPKKEYNIKKCKYSDDCWNIVCICVHNEIQAEYYKSFFIHHPEPYLSGNGDNIKICKYGNSCLYKTKCLCAHTNNQLIKMKNDLNERNKIRIEHWINSIKNDIGQRYGTTLNDFEIVLE